MLTIKTLVVTAVLATSAASALASQVLLTFEEASSSPTQVNDAYKANGIYFSPNGWRFRSQAGDCGGTGKFFGGNNNDVGCGAVELTKSADALSSGVDIALTINVNNGFTGLFSLLYTTKTGGSLEIYDGLDGQGTKLNQAALFTQPECVGGGGFSCNWATVSLDLAAATGKSIKIQGPDAKMFLDNIQLNGVNGGGPPNIDVPEPNSVALCLAALVALTFARKRMRR